jgi:disulfide bond formation protein DsbB
MSNRLGFWIAHLNILVVCGVLAGAFVVQFGGGDFPCPLCVLQRMAMMLCALGPAYVIMQARVGEVKTSDFATGYGMSVIAAVGGACISIRQILLHIVPPDPGYGDPVLGLHLYTWHCSSRANSSRERRSSADLRGSCSCCSVRSSPRTRPRSSPRRGCTGPCPTIQTATSCSIYYGAEFSADGPLLPIEFDPTRRRPRSWGL